MLDSHLHDEHLLSGLLDGEEEGLSPLGGLGASAHLHTEQTVINIYLYIYTYIYNDNKLDSSLNKNIYN